MGKILQFSTTPISKYGYKKAKKSKKQDLENYGQLNLFAGKIIRFPSQLSTFEIAMQLDEQGDSRAKEVYLKAIEKGDSIADAYCNLAILESECGKIARAFDYFMQALKNDPRHFESHYNLANLYFDTGDLKLALLHYEVAAEIEPEFSNTYFNLGLTHALNQQFDLAVTVLAKYKAMVSADEAEKADELLVSLKRLLQQRKQQK